MYVIRHPGQYRHVITALASHEPFVPPAKDEKEPDSGGEIG